MGELGRNALYSAAETATTQLRHDGIPYSGPADLVSTATSLAGDSVRTGAPCLVLADSSTVQAVRDALDHTSHPGNVAYFDMSVHGRNPARVLPAVQSFLDQHRGRRAQVISEPVAVGLTPEARTEAELNELIFGLPAYRALHATIHCLYDETALDDVATTALEVVHRFDRPAADAQALVSGRFGAALPPAPHTAVSIGADVTTLRDLRRAVSRAGRSAGLDDERTQDLVYAVNEVVTNSICHGEGRARVLVWIDDETEPGAVWCEVYDRGRITDPLVGRIAPRPGQVTGRGLWLVNQLCDLVQVRSSAAGTFVRMSVDLPNV